MQGFYNLTPSVCQEICKVNSIYAPNKTQAKIAIIARLLLLGSIMLETLQKYLEDISHIKENDKEHTHRTALQNLLESLKTHIIDNGGGGAITP